MKESSSEYRAPTDKPPFTLSNIKKVIPPHCFNRSLPLSLFYVVADLAVVTLLLSTALHLIPLLPSPLRPAAWPLYWLCQGCVLTGLWIIGHDCGHHAFSSYPLLDDTVGFLLHSFLLTPYFSWKITHRRHHTNIGSVNDDEAFAPNLKSDLKWHTNLIPAWLRLLFMLLISFQCHLIFNLGGRRYDRFASHYNPYGPQFSKDERVKVIVSALGVVAVVAGIHFLAVTVIIDDGGLWWVFKLYYAPVLVSNGCVVWITFLQHTHVGLPHYSSPEWEYLRGALSTVDRDYGVVLNWVFHDVTRSHVLHHLVSGIPHYHAMEATAAIRPMLGRYYRFDGTPAWKAVWREVKECLYVEEEEKKGIFWYQNEIFK